MAAVMVLGAKGGVGSSLVAVNMAKALAASGDCLLLDLVPVAGSTDLLLGQRHHRSWADLLPVAAELNERQLGLVANRGLDNVGLLAAPAQPVTDDPTDLLSTLKQRCDWLVIDTINQQITQHPKLIDLPHVILLVTTLDPPALRACHRWLMQIRSCGPQPVGLVVNQWTAQHPVDPTALAESLQVPLLAVIPYAQELIGVQVNFGQLAPGMYQTKYWLSIKRLVDELNHILSKESLKEY